MPVIIISILGVLLLSYVRFFWILIRDSGGHFSMSLMLWFRQSWIQIMNVGEASVIIEQLSTNELSKMTQSVIVLCY